MRKTTLNILLLGAFLSLSGCGDSGGGITGTDIIDDGDTGPFALASLSCDIEGVNLAPFTVADALGMKI